LLIERYLAAKFGTNFMILVWRVLFIKRDYAGLEWYFFYFLVVVISQVPSSNSDDSFKNLP
jgi:hypothetical protein